jgi:hypothetical protein
MCENLYEDTSYTCIQILYDTVLLLTITNMATIRTFEITVYRLNFNIMEVENHTHNLVTKCYNY